MNYSSMVLIGYKNKGQYYEEQPDEHGGQDAALVAYCYSPKKPSISLEHYHDYQLFWFS